MAADREAKYAAERYNRRTRAMEKQAHALTRIADAMEVQALAAAATARAETTTGVGRVWTKEKAAALMSRLGAKAGDL